MNIRMRAVAGSLVLVLAGALHPVSLLGSERSEEGLQDFAVTLWTTESGLPADVGAISAIAQDADGYLWLGTRTGLVRFDGFRFIPWRSGDSSFPAGGISTLITSRDGSLWMAHSDAEGVSRVHGQTFTHFSEADGLPNGTIQALVEDRRGVIWAGGHNGLAKFESGRWYRLGTAQGMPQAQIYSLFEDHSGRLWVGTSAGVFRRQAGKDWFISVDRDAVFVQAFADDNAGAITVTDPQRLVRTLDARTQPDLARALRLPLAGWRLLVDSHENLWIAALGAGLLRGRQNLRSGRIAMDAIADKRITGTVLSLFEDRENNVWVGMRGGLLRFAPSLVTMDTALEGLTNEGVRGLTVSGDGSVWVATTYGLNRFANGTRQVYNVKQIEALHTDRYGAVWMVTLQGVYRYRNGMFAALSLPPRLRLEGISSIATDSSDALWLCSRRAGLLRWQHGSLTRLDDAPEVTQRACRAVHVDRHGRVWVGFVTGGVAVYEGGHFQLYTDRDGFPTGNVTQIFEDEGDAVWICTTTGLSRFDRGRFVTLSARNGLPSLIGPAIVQDAEGLLWVTVGSGIIRLNPRDIERVATNPSWQVDYTFYDRSEGFSDAFPSLSSPAAVRDDAGRLWFATDRGVATIDPRRLRTSRRPLPVRIENIVADGRIVRPADSLTLSPYGSSLQIEYAALSLSAASKPRFRYRLEGRDGDWSYADERRQVSYTNLPRGTYEFRVTATNDGLWREPEAVWSFSVRPAFYQTRWFYAVCVLGVGLAICAYWWLSLRSVRKRYALVLAERMRVSREIHDTLLQSLGAVGLELEVVARHLSAREVSASDVLRRLQEQVANCIRDARQSVWDLRSPEFERRRLADSIRELLANATSGKPIQTSVVVSGDRRPYASEIEEELLRIAGEAINNAVRHARPEHIRIQLDYRDASLRLCIADDGCGFVPTETEPGHCGLLNMQERASRIGGRLDVTSEPGRGTIIDAVVQV